MKTPNREVQLHNVAQALRYVATSPAIEHGHIPGYANAKAPLFTALMVREICQSADLWEEAQDNYGEGAEGLAELIAKQARLLAATQRAAEELFLKEYLAKQASVETQFEYNLLDDLSYDLANLIRGLPMEEMHPRIWEPKYHELVFRKTAIWLGVDAPFKGWYVEFKNEVEGFYSDAETPLEAISKACAYHDVDASTIRKVEWVDNSSV